MTKLSFLVFICLATLNTRSQSLSNIEFTTSYCGATNFKTTFYDDNLSVNPNTFVEETVVHYSFANNDTVSLTIYNSLGMSVLALLTNSIMIAGSYQDSLKMNTFPDGKYLALLKLGHRKTISKLFFKSIATSLIENKNELACNIYPNPFKNKLTIETKLAQQESIQLSIYNSLSQEVIHFNKLDSKQEIDLSFLPAGLFYLKIVSDSDHKTFKILKE